MQHVVCYDMADDARRSRVMRGLRRQNPRPGSRRAGVGPGVLRNTMHFQQFPANFGVEPRRPDMGGCKQVLNLQMDSCSPAPGGHFSVRPLSPFDRKCRRILYSKCFISRALAEEEAALPPR